MVTVSQPYTRISHCHAFTSICPVETSDQRNACTVTVSQPYTRISHCHAFIGICPVETPDQRNVCTVTVSQPYTRVSHCRTRTEMCPDEDYNVGFPRLCEKLHKSRLPEDAR